jgi:hypothetical protein
VQSSQRATADQLRDAITQTVRALGSRECAARVAKEFGDHPETAVMRMRWAREQVASLAQGPRVRFSNAAPDSAPRPPHAA